MHATRREFLIGAAALAAHQRHGMAQSADEKHFAYVGAYTSRLDGSAHGEGISLFAVDPQTGALRFLALAAKLPNPTWIAIHPNRRFLYALSEIGIQTGGTVTAFAIDPENGALRKLNTVDTLGGGPAHLSIDATQQFILVANYEGGTLSVLPILASGDLGPAVDTVGHRGPAGTPTATDAPVGSFAISGHDRSHPHMIASDPAGRFVLATDLGEDRLYVYRLDTAKGKLTPAADAPFAALPAGNGPRHFVWHPNGKWLYLVEEEASRVDWFLYEPHTGQLTRRQSLSTLPEHFAGTSFASEIALAADARHLYCANRLHDSIAVFAIEASGKLHAIGEVPSMGDYPRHIAIHPEGKFLYACNQRSDVIACFQIDSSSGMPHFTGHYTPTGSPAVLAFL